VTCLLPLLLFTLKLTIVTLFYSICLLLKRIVFNLSFNSAARAVTKTFKFHHITPNLNFKQWAGRRGCKSCILPRPNHYRMTSPEVKVAWMVSWSKCEELGGHWIKGENHLWEQIQLCGVCLRMSKSPLGLIKHYRLCKIQFAFNRKSNGGSETGSTCTLYLILQMEYMWNFNGKRIL